MQTTEKRKAGAVEAIVISFVVLGIVAFIFGGMYLKFNPIFVESEEKIPAIIKELQPSIVKAGQIWGFDSEGKDPFESKVTRFHVVAVKKGYVKYYFVGQENYGEDAAQSEPAWYFVQYKKLIKR